MHTNAARRVANVPRGNTQRERVLVEQYRRRSCGGNCRADARSLMQESASRVQLSPRQHASDRRRVGEGAVPVIKVVGVLEGDVVIMNVLILEQWQLWRSAHTAVEDVLLLLQV